MKLIVEFRGGPCDGLVCSSKSADRIEAATALVLSLMALSRPTSAMPPNSQPDQRQTPARGPGPRGGYEVAQRTIKCQSVISIAIYRTGADLARSKRPEVLSPALSGPPGSLFLS